MKKVLDYSIFTFLLISLFVISQDSKAQLRDYGFKLGLQANYLNTANEYEDDGLSFLVRTYGRYELSKLFQLEGGIGYGLFQGLDYGNNSYMTKIVPLDLRLLVTPFELESWNPYLYGGVGATFWWLADPPKFPKRPSSDQYEGNDAIFELGIGTEIALNPNWALDIQLGYTAIYDDNPNGNASNLEDIWLHDYDRYLNIGVGVAYAFDDCNSDADNDGIGKCKEEELGLDPNNPDTDGDGLKDGDEMMKYNTDPKNADSDGDGLTDGSEVKTHYTNPNKADSDGDGLKDGEEVNTYNTDPNNADTDADDLSDGDEVNKYSTDPNKKDTDEDGLNDGAEVTIHKTDPTKADTDGDGLSDGEEVTKVKSNPLEVDTDKGSVGDGVEVKRGTDPLDASDDVMTEVGVKEFDPVLFGLDSYKIRESEVEGLKKVLGFMIDNADYQLVISGYTDNQGSASYNMKLSENRANAVKKWLVDKGVNASRVVTKGFGKKDPVADNSTESGRQKNRRAELKVDGVK